MAAPQGNQFWKLRSKHGRDKLFATPELMWEAACEYFQWCIDNPIISTETTTGTNGSFTKEIPKTRPFTMEGVCHYMDCNTAYFRNFKVQSSEINKDFNTVITRIEETIYRQKFEGAAIGNYNANIIARDLGLKDTQDLNVTGLSSRIID